MKLRKYLALQLFAEEPTPTEPTEPTEPTPNPTVPGLTEPKPTPTEPTEPKYTDEDVNQIIGRKFAEWEKKQQKKVDEATKLAEMNAQQKAEYERDQLQKQLTDYQKKETLVEMTKTARKMLAENSINVSDELLAMLVCTDAEQTKEAVDSFAKAFENAVEDEVKSRLKGEAPKKGTGKSADMTKEQIMSIQDPELRQQKMLENRELFNF